MGGREKKGVKCKKVDWGGGMEEEKQVRKSKRMSHALTQGFEELVVLAAVKGIDVLREFRVVV